MRQPAVGHAVSLSRADIRPDPSIDDKLRHNIIKVVVDPPHQNLYSLIK